VCECVRVCECVCMCGVFLRAISLCLLVQECLHSVVPKGEEMIICNDN
jgi:hypothetical protein